MAPDVQASPLPHIAKSWLLLRAWKKVVPAQSPLVIGQIEMLPLPEISTSALLPEGQLPLP